MLTSFVLFFVTVLLVSALSPAHAAGSLRSPRPGSA